MGQNMGKHKHLIQAKKAKKDEFYTRYEDIANEIEEYYKYNPNFLKDKTVLLPCDDYKKSNFVKYFSDNFERFGIKKLIATGVSLDGKGSTYFVRNKLKLIRKTDDGNAYGDFRNELVTSLRDEADVIFTNPPFSLFREFFTWCKDKELSIIGNLNAVAFQRVFESIVNERIRLGDSIKAGDIEFLTPDDYPLSASGCGTKEDGSKYIRVKGVRWFTTFSAGNNCKPLEFMSMSYHLKNTKKIYSNPLSYKQYDNFAAIEVPVSRAIPGDYKGLMGVPLSYLDIHNQEQIEIVGISTKWGRPACLDSKVNMGVSVGGTNIYKRILIKHRATS